MHRLLGDIQNYASAILVQLEHRVRFSESRRRPALVCCMCGTREADVSCERVFPGPGVFSRQMTCGSIRWWRVQAEESTGALGPWHPEFNPRTLENCGLMTPTVGEGGLSSTPCSCGRGDGDRSGHSCRVTLGERRAGEVKTLQG